MHMQEIRALYKSKTHKPQKTLFHPRDKLSPCTDLTGGCVLPRRPLEAAGYRGGNPQGPRNPLAA